MKKILFNNHVAKFVKNAGPESLQLDAKILDGVTTMKTKLIVSPTKEYPNIKALFYEVKYKNNILIIQEARSTKAHVNSGLHRTLFSLLKFHPEKYKAVKGKELKSKKTPKKK